MMVGMPVVGLEFRFYRNGGELARKIKGFITFLPRTRQSSSEIVCANVPRLSFK